MEENLRMQFALETIANIAKSAIDSLSYRQSKMVCTPKALPEQLLERAAQAAIEINPDNAKSPMRQFAIDLEGVTDRLLVAILTGKYWGRATRTLSVSFMESTSNALMDRILSHMNAWRCGIQFLRTSGVGDVRISRGQGGYWSYLGTDVRLIPPSQQTMNLEGFTMSTPDSEFYRVVRHETGHTLGMPHEHARRDLVDRIHRDRAIAYFWRTQRWDEATVNQQVLTPLDEKSLFSTPADQTSIMCYQLPAEITTDGRPILGGTDINRTDREFAQRQYPESNSPADSANHDCDDVDWSGDFGELPKSNS